MKHRPQRDYHRIKVSNNPGLSVSITGLHIDPTDCWLVASPDGLIKDPSEPEDINGLLEIKCPFLTESTCLMDVCKDKKHKSYFYLHKSYFYL